jgi:hypothetical protein
VSHSKEIVMKLLVLELVLAALAAGIVAFGFPRAGWRPRPSFQSLRAWAGAEWTEATSGQRAIWLGLLVAAFVARLIHIRQTMRNDEAYTFLRYASQPLATALRDYNQPNNHLFHTLLVWVSIRLFGSSPAAIRLPAFLAGMMIVVAVYVVARRFADRSTGLLAMALAAVWPTLVLYSTNARGYSIIALAFLVLLVLGDVAVDRESSWTWLGVALVVAIGMYTAPVMLYPVGVAGLWTLLEASRTRGAEGARALLPRVVASGAVAAVLTVMANLPVMLQSGLRPLVSNQWVTALSAREFVEALPVFAVDLIASCAIGIPKPALVVIAMVGLAGICAPGADRARRVGLALTALVWSAALMVLMRRPPPGRVFLFLVPLGCIYVALGARFILAALVRAPQRTLATNLLTCALVPVLAVHMVVNRTVFRAPESGTLVDAPQIAEYVLANLRTGDRIIVQSPSGPPLDYYMVRKGGQRMNKVNAAADRGRTFVVVNPRHLQTLASVQAYRSDLPWGEMVPDGKPVSFAPESVFVFRYASGN